MICIVIYNNADHIMNKTIKNKSDLWQRVVAGLAEKLESPSDTIPDVQWLSESALIHMLVDVRDSIKAPKSLTGTAMVKMLEESKLAQPLTVDDVPVGRSPHRVYCLDMGSVPEISPIELLISTQASLQNTVVCYFTAIQYHDLTTQVVPHHHIAILKEISEKSLVQQSLIPPSEKGVGSTTQERKPTLGTLLFNYQGVPYYSTSRDRSMVPGVQRVRLSPSCLVRLTTLEQTLLDTLQKPWHCGGAAVVFEAWERGHSLVDDERLFDCLQKIARMDLIRRVGYMLEHQGRTIGDPALAKLLSDATSQVQVSREPLIPLLPGMSLQSVDEKWGLYV